MQINFQNYASDGSLIIVFGDSHYRAIVENWIAHVEKLNIRNYLIVTLDEQLFVALQSAGKSVILGRKFDTLHELWLYRIEFLESVLMKGIDVIHSDADAVWLTDPLPDLLGSSRLDLVFSQGTVWPHDAHAQWGFVLCCGLFSLRSNPATLRFVSRWRKLLQEDGDDQRALNRLLLSDNVEWPAAHSYTLSHQDRDFNCFDEVMVGKTQELSVGLLPHSLFQRIAEPDHSAKVKHLVSGKYDQDVEETLKANGCWIQA